MPPYSPVSVPKSSANAGRPTGKKAFLLVFLMKDLLTFTITEGTPSVTGFEFLPGKKPIGIYATNTTQNVYHQSAGEKDARGFIHHADFEHPGDSVAFDTFMENNINEELGVIQVSCLDGIDCKIAGYPGNPLSITQDNSQDNKDANKHTVTMAQDFAGSVLGRIAKALIPETDSAEVNALLGLPSGSTGGGI